MFARKQILVIATLLAILGAASALPQDPTTKPTPEDKPLATAPTDSKDKPKPLETAPTDSKDKPKTGDEPAQTYAEPTGFNPDGSGGKTLGQDDPATERDETWPACDTPDQNPATEVTWKTGKASTYKLSDDKVFFLSPGQGACTNYTDKDIGICLKPGWLNSGYHNLCDSVVEVFHPKANVSSFARVVDACGAVENATFGCNDVYLTKALFETLAGNDTDAVDRGALLGQVQWRFLDGEQAKKAQKKHPKFFPRPFATTHSRSKSKNKADSWKDENGNEHASAKSASVTEGGALAGWVDAFGDDFDDLDDDDGSPVTEATVPQPEKASEKPEQTQTEEQKPADQKPSDQKPTEEQPTEEQPTEEKPADKPTPRRRSLRA
ncbi:hypothetical protein IE81DRAFT_341114 [Ceraceosorus guamensis]|uniref:Uncharacterized protein n=1 Tax=Ceraceosorus guamensis TaxID=1522189 RepID=A0A316W188_9BASI|nr:hypothetical protein IE81DRAFT_341114 [Ceraceosorus guamensis]PWN42888.1 hypothetical protein IE81DRAFT_341114 [Ceraceosorus guamensis]